MRFVLPGYPSGLIGAVNETVYGRSSFSIGPLPVPICLWRSCPPHKIGAA
jgi:hypothetical protein